jgi:hypothetical protein
VYPKRVGLLDEYLRQYGHLRVTRIIWAGPQADWDDYKTCFEHTNCGMHWNICIKSADSIGGRAWELIAIADKKNDHAG